jgi:hypothetical protein
MRDDIDEMIRWDAHDNKIPLRNTNTVSLLLPSVLKISLEPPGYTLRLLPASNARLAVLLSYHTSHHMHHHCGDVM